MRPPTTKITDLAAVVVVALAAVALAPLGALAQVTSGPTATVAQQWSSRIVNSDELAPPSSVSTPTTTLRKVARKVARNVRKAPLTSTTLAPGIVAPTLPRATASTEQGADQSAERGFAPEVWLALRKCESNNRYELNTGNGYYGAYQFKLGTWQKLGFPGYPHEAAPAVQDDAARVLQSKLGWGQWGACSRRLGLR